MADTPNMTEPASPSRADAGAIAGLNILMLNARSIAKDQRVHGGKCGPELAEFIEALSDALTALVTRCERLEQEKAVEIKAAGHWFTEANAEHNRAWKAEAALVETQARLKVASEAVHRLAGHLTFEPEVWERAEWETCEEEACIKDRAVLALGGAPPAEPEP